ncbi:MAG: DUF5652 family protein [Patescibacteria group bacterium]
MSPQELQLLNSLSWPIIILMLWSLPWKGVALWKAAKANHKAWFVVLFIVNTVGILEILYIFIFNKRKPKDPDIIHTTLNI